MSHFIAIDLKSFYASVECIERELDPLTTNLVVADNSRTSKTICLAISPSLKTYGISSRPRLFQVNQRIKEVNKERRQIIPNRKFIGKSSYDVDLRVNPRLEVDFIIAKPRMALYIEYSRRIYDVYLKYFAPEDIHVYSIDEVFIDVSNYLKTYKTTPVKLARRIMVDVLETTGITATAGVGSNLYLAKIAMDIVAKKLPPDSNGVRIAKLDEDSYRKLLWSHKPLTDFWRVGKGYAKKLEDNGLYTMGDIARCSLGDFNDFHNEDLLYKLFGINAELLIDHAWGYESCTMKDIKSYKPNVKSIGYGQVLHKPYNFDKTKLILKEMIDLLTLDMVDKEIISDQFVLTVGYDTESLNNTDYKGNIKVDHYGRSVPEHAHGTVNLKFPTSSTKIVTKAMIKLFDKIVDKNLLVRRVSIAATKVISESEYKDKEIFDQLDLFNEVSKKEDSKELEKEKKITKCCN